MNDPVSVVNEIVVEHEKQLVAEGESSVKTHLKALVADVEHDEVALRAKLIRMGAAVVELIHSIDHKAPVAEPVLTPVVKDVPTNAVGGGEVPTTNAPGARLPGGSGTSIDVVDSGPVVDTPAAT